MDIHEDDNEYCEYHFNCITCDIFRVGFAILRFIISAALILLGLYLGYQGILWIMENFQVLSAYIQ